MRPLPLHHCNACDQDLPADQFSKNKAFCSGLQNRCKRCMREYRKRYYHLNAPALRRKADRQRRANGSAPYPFITKAIRESRCNECGTYKAKRGLKLREGPRSFNLLQARQIGVSEERAREELRKYDIVCVKCCPPRHQYVGAYVRELPAEQPSPPL